MDKRFESLYNKLTNFFHSNNSSSSSSSSVSEPSSSLPISVFFDRLISTATNSSNDQRHNTSRTPRQISIKTNNNQVIIPNKVTRRQM